MQNELAQVQKDAMDLSPRQRLTLAGFLLDSAEDAIPEADAQWESEICNRVRAIDDGLVVGVSHEDVRRSIESQLGK